MVKKIGTYNLADGKIRINYSSGTESVLFEDVSSLSWKACKKGNPLALLLLIPVVLGFLSPDLIFGFIGVQSYLIVSIGSVVATIFVLLRYPIRWDNVIIETRGGKNIEFSVEEGEGMDVMTKIEEDKRNHVGK